MSYIISHPTVRHPGEHMIAHPYLKVAPEHPRPLSAPEPLSLPDDSPLFDWPEDDVRYQAWCDLNGAAYFPKSRGHLTSKPSKMWSACEYPERDIERGNTAFAAECDACYIAFLAHVSNTPAATDWDVRDDDGALTEQLDLEVATQALIAFEAERMRCGLWVWRDGRRMVPE